jgi:hypothetical protein
MVTSASGIDDDVVAPPPPPLPQEIKNNMDIKIIDIRTKNP